MAYCSLCGLDLLSSLAVIASERQALIDWIYSLHWKTTTTLGEYLAIFPIKTLLRRPTQLNLRGQLSDYSALVTVITKT